MTLTSSTNKRSPSMIVSTSSNAKKLIKSIGSQRKVEHDSNKILTLVSYRVGKLSSSLNKGFNNGFKKKPKVDVIKSLDEINKALVYSINYCHLEILFYKAKEYEIEYRGTIYEKDKAILKLRGNIATKDYTYSELEDFIKKNSATLRKYVTGKFMCMDFAKLLYDRAAKEGIRCGYVDLKSLNDTMGHAINVFFTPDRGVIFVDLTAPAMYDESGFDNTILPYSHKINVLS